MICKQILLITFVNEPQLLLLHTVKWFQVLLCVTNYSIKHQSFLYTHFNGQIILFQRIQFRIMHSFALILNVKQFYLTHR